MATKTGLINLALMKLHGVTSGATQIIESEISAAIFADPSTATGVNREDIYLYCTQYPDVLKKCLRDIQPNFARQYADLGNPVEVTVNDSTSLERASWEYLFQLPSDFLALMYQLDESDKSVRYDADLLTVHSWSHLVEGSNDQTYYCDTTHTALDNANDGEPPDDDANGNWTIFSTDGGYGADWEANKIYLRNSTGKLLVTNDLSNEDADSAYIRYIGYVAAGFADDPAYYDDEFVQAFVTLLASEMAPWSDDYRKRDELRQEYEQLVKPAALFSQVKHRTSPGKTAYSKTRTNL